MDVSPSAFVNQLMYFRNPSIQSFDDREFTDVQNVEYAPYSHEAASQAYLPVDERSDIGRFKYKNNLSTDSIAVYKSDGKTQREKRILYGHRGTASVRDIGTDIALTAGVYHKTRDAKEALDHFDKTRVLFPNHTHHLSGHSKASITTSYLHHSRPGSVSSSIGYNSPGGLGGVGSGLIKKFYKTKTQDIVDRNRIDFINSLDPVSTLSFNRKHSKKNKHFSSNPHDLSQWTHLY